MSIDAASFSAIRLASGAVTLLMLVIVSRRQVSWKQCGNWTSALMLFLYVITFSFAYRSLSAGTGALILFGAVQMTMVLGALRSGESPTRVGWLGIVMAVAGLAYLLLPGLSAPSPAGAALMLISGMAWGIYSLLGRQTDGALLNTAGNFIRALPMIAVVSLISIPQMHISTEGIILAVLSGALASGVGYAIWYTALTGLTTTHAAVVQLSVPVLTAIGGVVFLAEAISGRLILSSIMILCGIWLTIISHNPARNGQSKFFL